MPDPFAPEGVLPNLLRWIDRPGQAVRNVLRGDIGAAGRQAAEFLVEPIDAALPGDWIPDIAQREDYVSGSELLGITTPGMSTAADIGVSVLSDPLTYLSFGALPAAKTAATGAKYGVSLGIPFTAGKYSTVLKATEKPVDPLSLAMRGSDVGLTASARKLDEMRAGATQAGGGPGPVQTGYEDLKAWVRRATGSENITPAIKGKMQEAKAEESTATRVHMAQAEKAMQGLDKEERVLLTAANLGIDIGSLKPGRVVKAAVIGSDDFLTNIDALAAKYGKDAEKLKARAALMSDIGARQFDEAVAKQAMAPGVGAKDYLARRWLFDSESNPLGARTLKTPQDVADFLNTGEVGLEMDAAKLLLQRAQSHGSMLAKAKLAKSLAPGSAASLVKPAPLDPEGMTLLEEAKKAIPAMGLNRDETRALTDALSGMPARQGFLNVLSKATKPVKGAMVYGVLLPKIGSIVRNKVGMGMQTAATPGVREEAFKQLNPVHVLGEMGKAADEAYGTTLFGKMNFSKVSDELTSDMQRLEAAFAQAKGTDDVVTFLRKPGDAQGQVLADAVQHGVLDGFVSTEEILSKLGRDPKWDRFWDIYNAPAKMFSYIEQRGRLMTFKNLLAKQKTRDPGAAARLTKDALYDYEINSTANRALRDVVPFAQFMVKAIPQQAKWLSEQPAIGAAMAPLFYDASGDEPPVYPWMQGRSRISAGTDAAGNPLFLTGFGLPMESIDVLPNLSGSLQAAGRDIQQGMISSTSPALKTAAAIAFGEDPYFGTPFGTYGKLPVVGEAGGVGRFVNVVSGLGVLEPFGYNIARQVGQAIDAGKPGAARAIDLASGAKLISVDPNIAEQRAITAYLEQRPDIQQYRTFFKQGDADPEFSALMDQLRAAKQRAKAAREAAASAAP